MCCFVKLPRQLTSMLVGRVPTAVGPLNQPRQPGRHHQQQQHEPSCGKQTSMSYTQDDSSGTESPQTIMEASKSPRPSESRSIESSSTVGHCRRQSVAQSSIDRRKSVAKSGSGEDELMRRQQAELSSQKSQKESEGVADNQLDTEVGGSPGAAAAAAAISQRRPVTRHKGSLVRQTASIGGDETSLRDDAKSGGGSASSSSPATTLDHHQTLPTDSGHHHHTPPDSGAITRQDSTSTAEESSLQEYQRQSSSGSGTNRRESRRRRNSRRKSSGTRAIDSGESIETTNQLEPAPTASSQLASVVSSDLELRKRASRSQPPSSRQLTRASSKSHLGNPSTSSSNERTAILDARRSVSVSPSVANQVNIRQVLENVAEVEGAFQEPQLAYKVAIDALEGPCWSTKVEGLLALIRLATYHQQVVVNHLHEVVSRTVAETRNLRSTVARSAIFALADYCTKLKRLIEPEMDNIVQALLHKSIENTAFIRDDIRRALVIMVEHLTQWRLANSLIHHGANHKNTHARRMASQFVAMLVERMGPARCLVGARDISAQLLPAAAKFAQDNSPHTRYYGRLILARIMAHSAFERLLRKNLTPNLYRSTIGIIESVKRRGPGELPNEI